MIGKFFHIPKSKQFSIPYRYYNPDKEEMKAREQRIKHELGIEQEKKENPNYRETLRGSFRSSMVGDSKTIEDARRRSNIRLIIIILVLVFLFYLVFLKS